MDSSEAIQSLKADLAEIAKIIVWMEKSREINQIDIDVLLNKTRYLYNQLLRLPVGPFEDEDEIIFAAPKESSKVVEPAVAMEPIPAPVPEPIAQPETFIQIVAEPVVAEPIVTEPIVTEPIVTEPIVVSIEPEITAPEPLTHPQTIQPSQTVQSDQPLKPEQPYQSYQSYQPSQPSNLHQPAQQQAEPARERKPDYFNLPYNPPVPKSEKQPARGTISDASLFQRDGSLNDALGKQKPVHDIASSITDVPIGDIWSAITINERFLFIRELFGNDPDGFKKTVTALNGMSSWDTAERFMEDRFEWDKNNPVATDFRNVVRRRFLR